MEHVQEKRALQFGHEVVHGAFLVDVARQHEGAGQAQHQSGQIERGVGLESAYGAQGLHQ